MTTSEQKRHLLTASYGGSCIAAHMTGAGEPQRTQRARNIRRPMINQGSFCYVYFVFFVAIPLITFG